MNITNAHANLGEGLATFTNTGNQAISLYFEGAADNAFVLTPGDTFTRTVAHPSGAMFATATYAATASTLSVIPLSRMNPLAELKTYATDYARRAVVDTKTGSAVITHTGTLGGETITVVEDVMRSLDETTDLETTEISYTQRAED